MIRFVNLQYLKFKSFEKEIRASASAAAAAAATDQETCFVTLVLMKLFAIIERIFDGSGFNVQAAPSVIAHTHSFFFIFGKIVGNTFVIFSEIFHSFQSEYLWRHIIAPALVDID